MTRPTPPGRADDDTPTVALPPLAADGAIRIGRREDCDIVVADPLVSRLHASLVAAAAGCEIIDDDSINGTFVNGRRVARRHDHPAIAGRGVDGVGALAAAAARRLAGSTEERRSWTAATAGAVTCQVTSS